MAIWTMVEEFEVQGYKDATSMVHVQEYTPGRFRAIFDSLTGLETTMEFDEVVCDGATIEFYRTVGSRRIKTGDIERNSDQMEEFFETLVSDVQVHAR